MASKTSDRSQKYATTRKLGLKKPLREQLAGADPCTIWCYHTFTHMSLTTMSRLRAPQPLKGLQEQVHTLQVLHSETHRTFEPQGLIQKALNCQG